MAFFLDRPGGRIFALLLLAVSGGPGGALAGPLETATLPIGDTLTVIQRPLLNIPAIVRPGDTLRVECSAPSSTTGWSALLARGSTEIPLAVLSSTYDASTLWWTIRALVPAVSLYELYDLRVAASGGIQDATAHAVRIIPSFKNDYYFIHITDTHLPTNLYYYEPGSDTDSSELVDLRAVIDDIRLIHPEFVLLTGDFVNEGELEDYLGKRYYTRAQMALGEFDVPVYLTAGNHDIGGWDNTPPSDGTARRDWWRFFGWKRLNDPPAGAPARTQDYSFDYGPVHYVGLEAYNNYDGWRPEIYGTDSFRSAQLAWLASDLAAASGSTSQVLFHHRDFQSQLNLSSLGLEMALWGHVHSDQGNINQTPYNLSTNNVGNGERSFRLVRVSGGVVHPTATLSSGSTGQNLRVQFGPSNDGSADSVAAVVTNTLAQQFENGLLRFLMPKGMEYHVTNGTLQQVDETGSVAVCYVGVNIPASGSRTVTVTATGLSGVAGGVPARLRLDAPRPNPFNPSTTIAYAIGEPGQVRLSIHDAVGREVARLEDGPRTAGDHAVIWDGAGASGAAAPSGVYFVLLSAQGETLHRKIVLAR
jgi:3',5'-cyclic AMP phosphodiesterase CpdA